jgi:ATP-dependent DNA helicase RecG
MELIKEGESLTLESKSDRRPLPDDEMLQAIICFVNHLGGHLLFGVEDNGEISGLHKKHFTTPGSLTGFIASRTVPPLSVEVDFIDNPGKK